MIQAITDHIDSLRDHPEILDEISIQGKLLYQNGQVLLLSQSQSQFDFLVDDAFDDFEVKVMVEEDSKGKHHFTTKCNCKTAKVCTHQVAALMQVSEELERLDEKPQAIGKAYTREGMIKRVLQERRDRAKDAEYRIQFAENKYGEHTLITEKAQKYQITFRDLEAETGYCSCPDHQTNKLGTCKHLMFAFDQLKKKRLAKAKHDFPFIDVFLDPLNDYRISWYHPKKLSPEFQAMFDYHFDGKSHLEESMMQEFLQFLETAESHKQILVRPEVHTTVENYFDEKSMEVIKDIHDLDFSMIKADLYPYQKEGVEFATFKKACIIADEMGLGKTLQAIATAIMKKEIFDFKRTLIICPASLKDQWKKEIEKFSDEKAVVVQGLPDQREEIYRDTDAYFLILNYETVLRDRHVLNKFETDFIILDEAQRIKNYTTLTARNIKSLSKKHALVITGTPIENRLIDLFSIMDFIDPNYLTPLWEFSYQHCYFDEKKKNKITGYYNLQGLKERMKPFLIRRQKREVIKQLPNVQEVDIPVAMHPLQEEYHSGYARGIAKIIHKKFLTPYDMRRLQMLLANMRMVCDSTFLIDQETNHSPKLEELKHILIEKLDVKNNERKIIIFSEWTRMLGLISKLLRELDVNFSELSGKVPIKKRQALVDNFNENPDCRIFLSTEAGGTGLNLQSADTVINFELPWNPAKKNQRIGRIDRLGQRNKNLTVINLITRNSIEMRIATGLVLKQTLFDNVLNAKSNSDRVDFSSKGRSQFLQQLESMMDEMMQPGPDLIDQDTLQEETIANLETITQEVPESPDTPPVPAITLREPAQPPVSPEAKAKQMQDVMNQGMSFLSGLFNMATGQQIEMQSNAIEINPDTGEVVMRFKMPV